jgi:hypothetical protein
MKSLYKFLLVFAVSVLMANIVKGQATLSLPTINAASGSVAVNVNATGLNDMISFQFTVTYDNTKLAYVSISNWYSGISNVMVNNNSSQGYVTFSYFNVNPVSLNSGVFFTINFTYTTGAANLAWSNTPTPLNIMTSAGQAINPVLTNGSVNPIQNYTITTSSIPPEGGSTGGDGTFQSGSNCTVTASQNGGYAFTNWTENGTQVSTNPSYSFIVTANRGLIANFSCILPSPAGTITGTSSVCQGQNTVNYLVPVIANATSYDWEYTGTGATLNGNSNSISISFAENATSGNLSVKGSNVCGSGPVSENFPITVNALPMDNAGSDATICQTGTHVLSGSAANYESVLWSTSGNGTFSSTTILDPIYTPGATDITVGTVTLTLTVSAISPCTVSATDTKILVVQKSPVANAGVDATISSDETFTLTGSATNFTSMLWSTTGNGTFSNTSVLNPIYTPGTSDITNGSAEVCLMANGIANCESVTDCMTLTINQTITDQIILNAGWNLISFDAIILPNPFLLHLWPIIILRLLQDIKTSKGCFLIHLYRLFSTH